VRLHRAPDHLGAVEREQRLEVGVVDEILERAADLEWYEVAPFPTIALVSERGDSAAANRVAGQPTSGPTTCGAPSPHSSISRTRKRPIACGE
jgi:hypothetical protein